jgi:hypothetical protein
VLTTLGIVLVFVGIAIGVLSNWLDKPQRLTGRVVVGLLVVLAFVSFGLSLVKDNEDANDIAAPPSTTPGASSTRSGMPPVPDTQPPRSSTDWVADVNSVCREPLSRVRDKATQVKNAPMDPSDEDWAMLVSAIAEEISGVLPRISGLLEEYVDLSDTVTSRASVLGISCP